MKAPKFDSLLEILSNKNYNPESYDVLVKEKINKLYDLLDKIKPISSDEYKVLYFDVSKGTAQEYGNYKELKECGEVKNYKEYIDRFNTSYPSKIYWYKMISTKYKNYRMITINSKNVIYADMDKETIFESSQLQELLDFLISKTKKCLKQLEEGTYNKYIEENYSYSNRFGVIKRQDYWNICPESKEILLNNISQEGIKCFIDHASDRVGNRIGSMTSGKYFEYVGLIYKSIGYDIDNMPNKELYLKYADGRDEGLSQIDENSNIEFDKWYNDDAKYGGHPWEIIRGHSFSRVNLQVRKDGKGYYLLLDGKILRKIEIIKIFNVLNKNNIPVKIYNADIIKDALRGNDYIGIVPDEIIPIECSEYFKKYRPTEFIHIKNKAKENKIFKYIKWEPLENIELR